MTIVEETRACAPVPYPHIFTEQGKPARLASTLRMKVSHLVIEYLNWGWSPEEMCHQHPFLTLPEAYAAMAYYFDHQAEIDAEIEADDRAAQVAMAEVATSPLLLRLRALRTR